MKLEDVMMPGTGGPSCFFRYMSYRISFLYCTRNKYREGPGWWWWWWWCQRRLLLTRHFLSFFSADASPTCPWHPLKIVNVSFFCSWCCGQMIHTQTAVEILKRGPFFFSVMMPLCYHNNAYSYFLFHNKYLEMMYNREQLLFLQILK